MFVSFVLSATGRLFLLKMSELKENLILNGFPDFRITNTNIPKCPNWIIMNYVAEDETHNNSEGLLILLSRANLSKCFVLSLPMLVLKPEIRFYVGSFL